MHGYIVKKSKRQKASNHAGWRTKTGKNAGVKSAWYVVPADVKKNARLIVSRIILDTMKEFGMSYPTVDKARLEELQAIRKEL